ncbi:MAG: hypothetical protein R3C28_13800 [Pirellulaceae bacterium]
MLGKRVVRAAFAASVFLDFQTGFFDRFGQSVGGVGRIVGVAKVDAKLIGVRNAWRSLFRPSVRDKVAGNRFQLLIFLRSCQITSFPRGISFCESASCSSRRAISLCESANC